jgi:RNA polymerase sigma-70 factor (ECF subfamily)
MRVDEIAIREFLHTSYPRLVAAVALTSGSRPAAEDAVQEALIRAWERSDKGEEVDSLEGWVTTVALNLARSGLRRLRSERRARARLRRPATGEPPTADRIDIDRALVALPRRQREAAVLRYYLQLSTADAAKVMGISEGTVKSNLARARASLSERLGVIDDTLATEEEEANNRGTP